MPPTRKTALPLGIYQLKVTLLRTTPPIWRRLLVPGNLSMARLHEILQAAMGWENYHLHEFQVGRRRIGEPDPDDRLTGMPEMEDDSEVLLSTLLTRVGAKAIYRYDFGDGWDHEVVLEKRLARDPDKAYPVCTDGNLACPPEDCGGISGYYNLLDAIADPRHKRHDELIQWAGEDYDPNTFAVDSVNRSLRPFQRKPRRRKVSDT